MKQAQYLETGRSHLKVVVEEEEDEVLETIPEEVPNPENSIGFQNVSYLAETEIETFK